MRKALLVFLALALPGTMVCAQQTAVKPFNAGSHTISGDYVETRSADVYVGQCFANGEMGTALIDNNGTLFHTAPSGGSQVTRGYI